MKKFLVAGASACLAVVVAAPAAAQIFDFSFTATSGLTGSGTLTVDAGSDATGYLVDAITGSVTPVGSSTSYAISGLVAPGTYPLHGSPSASNDNLLFPNAATTVDGGGFAFLAGNGAEYDIFSRTAGYAASTYKTILTLAVGTTFTLTPEAAAVPEPATWAMLLSGFGLVGAGLRRRSGRMVQAV